MNIGTIVVLTIVVMIVALAARSIIKDKKSGKTCSGCSGSCSGCSGSCSASKMVDSIMKETNKK